jgi:hypothetical protein
MVVFSVDFDQEDNKPLIRRYVVLGLPTTVVLEQDGSEVGRIMGYRGKADWLRRLNSIRTKPDPIPHLEAKLRSGKGGSAAVLQLGELLLGRGKIARAMALLERLQWAPKTKTAHRARALFLMGRYYHRVRQAPKMARHLWRELATRFPKSDYSAGARWWYAKAEAETGQKALGCFVLRRAAEKKGARATPALHWAAFVNKHEMKEERKAVAMLLKRRRKKAPKKTKKKIDEMLKTLAGAK